MSTGIILFSILIIFVGVFVVSLILSLLSEYRHDKAVKYLRTISKAPVVTGDLFVQVNDTKYKVKKLESESYPKFNTDTGIAYWSEPTLERIFKYMS